MKLLWLCNIMLPRIAKSLSMPYRSTNGWLTGLSEELLGQEAVEFMVSFPVTSQDTPLEGEAEGLAYYGFPWSGRDYSYQGKTEEYFVSLLERIQPEVIHIFGTEFPHTLAMVRACERTNMLSRAVISIQGLVSVYAEHFLADLPEQVVHSYTLRDFLKRDNILQARESYRRRGQQEQEALQKVSHVIGRTDWDQACVEQLHPGVQYHFCNETLRSSFYEHVWSLEACERHSIFVSQWGYPIKGFHKLLEALPQLIREFPDVRVYTTGDSPLERKGWKDRLRQNSYQKYVKELIGKYRLEDYVVFLGGELDEERMREAFLRSHVFLSPSSIENSPNSLGEAMLLGVPCVSSDVGGVKNMLVHGEEGFLYPFEEQYMIAYYIGRIFQEEGLALALSEAGREHARKTHDPKRNLGDLMGIYGTVSEA